MFEREAKLSHCFVLVAYLGDDLCSCPFNNPGLRICLQCGQLGKIKSLPYTLRGSTWVFKSQSLTVYICLHAPVLPGRVWADRVIGCALFLGHPPKNEKKQ